MTTSSEHDGKQTKREIIEGFRNWYFFRNTQGDPDAKLLCGDLLISDKPMIYQFFQFPVLRRKDFLVKVQGSREEMVFRLDPELQDRHFRGRGQ